ncbi:hypothetical protein GCM10009680_82250 [Streptomyces yatensis]|uniref:Integrase n=1 Tax=Streptomyces yatensis TaxID=155177 RepID=A0ABP4VMF5_9ACTN
MIDRAAATAHLGVTHAFAMLRLLPMGDRDKTVEILALRHQIMVMERQLGKDRVRFAPTDRAFLAALLHRLPMDVLRRVRLLVRPDTVLRWHRDLLARRHAAASRPRRSGRPRTVHSVRALHAQDEQFTVQMAASTVWEILQEAGVNPAPERSSSTWADFLRSQADAVLPVTSSKRSPCPGLGCRSFVPPRVQTDQVDSRCGEHVREMCLTDRFRMRFAGGGGI